MKWTGFIKRHPLLSALVAAFVLAGSAWTILNLRQPASEIIRPRRGPIVEAVYGIGTVTSRSLFRSRVGVANALRAVYVREGDLVKKGTLLFSLVEGRDVHAPFTGTVTSLNFHTGENVFPDSTILTIEDLTDRYVVATLEQQGALRVKRGMPVRLNFESIRSRSFDGTVRSVFPQSGQFLVHIEVKDLPEQILPGMTADVAIEIARRDDVLLIPAIAVSGGKVVVRRGGRQQKIDVGIGTMDGQWAEVASGDLAPEDEILVKRR